ncbi:mannitol 2-dehydrogenase/sorbose reductase [Faunimonas pinastri]|uniref:Mannitol 2-dehydrogenase/sorbose reductase n=1 Tax=Faunimonas pinastri TaxID=1855383 RepID=A0A1H9C520_9HYPH|nr:mannitol dehydrogenase family protein [Faunimonas pinastri]SEP95778.1 mannitol 2-dehydrogenase/sorbose reductase [Faunimonas pinastri]
MTELSQKTLAELGSSVALPGYDRSALRAGIVHFGVGNFHRVHLAVYVDRCLAEPGSEAWGICGVELIDNPGTRAKAEAYRAQDNLYTVTESAPDGSSHARVIGAMIEYLHAPADPEAVLRRLADPATHIASLTITEGGYNLDEATGEFNLEQSDVQGDLSGAPLRTVFAYIVEGLRRRRDAGLPAFTVMSCDNLRHNGDTARKAITGYARAMDGELAEWIDRNAAFPNSMVDRIAPQVPEAVRIRLNEHSGVDDRVPALGEDFMQFVLEDIFSDGRPDFGSVGVELRSDVAVFEVMKQRILNASHMMLGYPGLLIGQRIVHEAMRDERLFRLLDTFCDRDVIPNLQAPEGVSLPAYKAKVLERFANPAINDQLQRLSMLGWSKFPIYHGKILEALLARGMDTRREAFFLACIERYLAGVDDKGESFTVDEPQITPEDWAMIRSDDPVGFLRGGPFAPLGLADHPTFREQYLGFKRQLADEGCAATLDGLLAATA